MTQFAIDSYALISVSFKFQYRFALIYIPGLAEVTLLR